MEPPEDAELYLPTVWLPPGKLTWKQSSNGTVPADGLKAGISSSGSDIYVIRATVGADLLPGILQDGHLQGCVAVNSKMQSAVDIYEVLCGDPHAVSWVPSVGGEKVSNAVIGGMTATGEMLFIGRAHHERALVPGKIHPSLGHLCISYFGKYTVLCGYEILVGI